MTQETIVRIASRGEGVTASGRHVPLAAPGDIVETAGAVLLGPHHAVPACRHYPLCGGCQLQHVDDAAYAEFVAARIVGALNSQGLDAPALRPVHVSPPRSRRRVSLRAERKGRRLILGFNEGQSHGIVDLAQCETMHPALFAMLDPLRALLLTMLRDKRGAVVQMTLSDQGVDLLLEKVEVEGLEATEVLTAFAIANNLARLSIDQGYGPETRWEPQPVTAALGGVAVPLPIRAFLQATADGEASLVAAVREAVGDAKVVADLFSGLGTFALSLSGKLLAVEGSRDSVLSLKSVASRSGGQLFVDHRDLFRRPLMAAELDRFDAIVLDPPRAGAKEQAEELAKTTALKRIAYVSCNPATFARDAKALVEAGFKLDWIQPVGQFRWSTHVELAAAFSR